jgi:hypothetical protein
MIEQQFFQGKNQEEDGVELYYDGPPRPALAEHLQVHQKQI